MTAQKEKPSIDLLKSLNDAQAIAHVGNWDWNITDNTLFWTDEIYRIFGIEPQEFAATYDAFIGRVHPEDVSKVKSAVDKALKKTEDYDVTHRITTPDRGIRIVREVGNVEFNEKGEATRMIGVVHDITDKELERIRLLKKIEEQQIQIDKCTCKEKTDSII